MVAISEIMYRGFNLKKAKKVHSNSLETERAVTETSSYQTHGASVPAPGLHLCGGLCPVLVTAKEGASFLVFMIFVSWYSPLWRIWMQFLPFYSPSRFFFSFPKRHLAFCILWGISHWPVTWADSWPSFSHIQAVERFHLQLAVLALRMALTQQWEGCDGLSL